MTLTTTSSASWAAGGADLPRSAVGEDRFRRHPDERNENRGEAKRRAEQFFRMEASVGMD